jgi:UrcA family protein
MTTKLYELCGTLVIVGACYAGSSFAGPRDTEEVTVKPPYTIRMQPLAYNLSGMVQEARTTVESNVSYADLDFSQQTDVDTMRDRLKTAARTNCRAAYRNPHLFGYIPTDEAACVRGLTLQSFAELDTIRADANRFASRQSARR